MPLARTLVLSLVYLLAAAAVHADSAAPVRVATLLPFVTDALAKSNGAVEVVATVRRSPVTPVAAGMADLGNPHTPNIELLVGSRARFVVADRAMHAALAPRLEQQGLEVVLVDTTSVDGTFASLLELGTRIGAGDAYAKAIADARAHLDAVKPERNERVLALLGMPTSFFVMTKRSWQGDLLARIGFENVAADAVGDDRRMPGFVPLSDEILAGLAPNRVLLVAHGDPTAVRAAFERRMQERGIWRKPDGQLPTVEILAPERFLSNPGLALPDVAVELVGGGAPPPVAAP